MICLSVAGVFIAGMQYFAVDLPQQKAVTAPANGFETDGMYECQVAWAQCTENCGRPFNAGYDSCANQCSDALMICLG